MGIGLLSILLHFGVTFAMWSRFRNLLILLVLPWLLAACAGLPALPTFGRNVQPADPLATQRQALAPSQRGLLDELPPLPDYRMEVQVDPAAPLVTGRLPSASWSWAIAAAPRRWARWSTPSPRWPGPTAGFSFASR
jgi:hypothetical protein